MRCDPALLDINAALWADGLPGPALAGRVAYRCILAALGLALSVLLVSGLLVSDLLVSALGSTAAGRSIYFGASAAGGASAILDPSVAFAGAVTVEVSPPQRKAPITSLRGGGNQNKSCNQNEFTHVEISP